MPEIIQKATEYAKQSAAFKKRRPFDTLHQTHWYQPKYDGCHLLIDTTAQRAFSRTNEDVRSVDHLIGQACAVFGRGWVLQGEAYHPDKPFPEISGMFRRHSAEPELDFMAYDAHEDYMFYAGFNPAPYHERVLALERLGLVGCENLVPVNSTAALGSDPNVVAHAYVVSGGYDGLILRDPLAKWRAGLAHEGELIKVKPSVSLDLVVVGIIQATGEKTGRDVFKLVVHYRGDHVIGSGVPHKIEDLPTVGQIVEIEAMCINPNGTFREPRFKAIRHDKTEPDE